MNIVVYVFSGVFVLLCLGTMFDWYRTRHPGLLLLSATYGSAAGLALLIMHWWPLLLGFAIVWIMRLMGFDPDTNQDQGD
ncbi:MAG: hypothetical protein KIT18_16185 [Burkholderiales bacterium]|nr:hypothetical protein [Burkholderiales bacterium]